MFANDTFNTVVKLPFANVAAFEKKMGELQKVAKKLGLEEIQSNLLYKIFEFRKVMVEGIIGYKEFEYTVYEVSGKGPVLNGWTLLGALDFDRGKDFPMVRTAPGFEVPNSYFETTSFCEHCNSQRFRKVVYILQNEEGKTIQVGSSCLKDFVGHGPIEDMVKYFTLIQSLPSFGYKDEDEMVRRCSVFDLALDKKMFLENLIKFVNKFGYVSRKAIENGFNASMTTAEQLSYAFASKYRSLSEDEKDNELITTFWKEESTEEVKQQAKNLLVEVSKLDPKISSFNHNLRNLASASYWKLKDLGFVASMYPVCFKKTYEKKEETVKVVSEFLGYVNVKLEVEITILNVMRMESEWGRSYMYISKDSTGNIVVFYNKKTLGEKDEVIKIKGKVKSHNLYREEKQTILNYVKLI